MKKFLALMLVLMLVATGCSGDKKTEVAGSDGDIKVGYAINNMNDTFQTYIVDAAKEKADEYGYSIDIQDAQEDVIKQQDQVNAMIEQGVDAIIVVPVDTSAMDPITKAVTEAGIPLVYVNRNPFGEGDIPEGVFYVGSQEIVAGQFQGEYLIKLMGEEGGVAILMGILSNEGAVKRTEGNEEILSQYPGIKILAKESGNWQKDQGMDITENWLTAYGDELNAILANNDEMALGALNALETAGRNDVIVMGIDAIPDAVKLVAEGKMAATVLQDADGQGHGAVEVVHNALEGNEQDSIRWIDFVLITPENVADFQ
ncbi:Periplasmic binding protein and sugar binding domain of the LacI family protein [[Clostridium] ultunense Esp]|uniref:Periplasmic binding protein and sugar binding domain of the LacI family protein n=1 Tax=[Clostridium] ultunense Esp TaxID=1288971 RepID=M1ZLQ8_9FIRM|nr:sugar ABC transporter substrate-binding protein [Schnuerera ultunensis]CCQ97627.1 Periplasmic binding protein and sugar binding domain of the LacI family protein [[Clostridium] ultunense Esp]SHD75755.1 Periplasmic binding protein and sugar binding domain of the LacI family protein [[Clostridium] ultunense Esp]